ncbi:hypothetical protein SJI19_03295 [Acerihabitans sp. TG2]|uniref:hypothetical protein n=1 Tax=Acerihabitans sp. TG2 TaxID=3096008 RepID=UPI002B221E87|nr:hypothetical protein [Acerihabitans sp. TG2]MEA9389587.1 hypothetical protein [Acerihabitans sp. TG2]
MTLDDATAATFANATGRRLNVKASIGVSIKRQCAIVSLRRLPHPGSTIIDGDITGSAMR